MVDHPATLRAIGISGSEFIRNYGSPVSDRGSCYCCKLHRGISDNSSSPPPSPKLGRSVLNRFESIVARKKLEEEENPENFNIPLPVVICYFDAQLTRTKNKLSTLLTTLS